MNFTTRQDPRGGQCGRRTCITLTSMSIMSALWNAHARSENTTWWNTHKVPSSNRRLVSDERTRPSGQKCVHKRCRGDDLVDGPDHLASLRTDSRRGGGDDEHFAVATLRVSNCIRQNAHVAEDG